MEATITNNLSTSVAAAMDAAKSLAARDGHSTYGVAHMALALLHTPTGVEEVLRSMGKDLAYLAEWFEVRKEMYQSEGGGLLAPKPDQTVERVLDEAGRSKLKLGTDTIDGICVFMAIVRQGVAYDSKQLESISVTEDDLMGLYNTPALSLKAMDGEEAASLLAAIPHCAMLATPKNLEDGALAMGRDREIRGIVENLARHVAKGTLLVGDPGIGKTALVKGLAKHLAESDNPMLADMALVGVNAAKLLASSSGEHEVAKKLGDILDKLAKIDNCLVVIDDMHTLTAGEKGTVANLVSAQLGEGNIRLLATIYPDAYRKNIENHALGRKMETIWLTELSPSVMAKCLGRHAQKLAGHYQIAVGQAAIDEAVHCSKRYFKESKLPQAAIDLLDRTLAAVKTSNATAGKTVRDITNQLASLVADEGSQASDIQLLYRLAMDRVSPMVTSHIAAGYDLDNISDKGALADTLAAFLAEAKEIASRPAEAVAAHEVTALVAGLTGIPIGKIQAGEKDRLLNIGHRLRARVKGQDHAISALADAIIESRSGLGNAKQPIGSFFFLGPTGTGKTELAKSLAELLFDDERALVRFDMSEFKEEHSAALLYGAPPGYVGYEEGGMLVNKIRQKPYAIVLFDEIEKAHSSVYDVFLQIMDEGRVMDKLGREGDFSNAIIIFTSNIGSQWIATQFAEGKTPASNALIEVMGAHFRPEFLGRITEVVPFAPIDEQVAQAIFALQAGRLQAQLAGQKNIRLGLTDQAIAHLAAMGFSKQYGARPIAGVVRAYLKKAISRMIVAGDIGPGDTVGVDFRDDSLVWEKQ